MILTNTEPPGSGIRLEDTPTRVSIDNEFKGNGTLYISESDIRWLNDSGEGFTLNYPNISIFAISSDREKHQEECLYLLVQDEDKPVLEDEDDELDIDYSGEVEIRFVPSDGVSVKDLFRVVQECSKLHPDENNSLSDDSEEDVDHDSGDVHVLNGNHVPGQFDDAE